MDGDFGYGVLFFMMMVMIFMIMYMINKLFNKSFLINRELNENIECFNFRILFLVCVMIY